MSDCVVKEYTDESSDFTENFKGGFSENTDSSNTFSNKSELETLIDILKKGIEKNEHAIKYIKFPNLLVESLEDLNSMIGMHRLKDSVALQTVRLIENLKTGEKSTAMLNTILTGEPGVGKTQVAIKLAKIWFALGFLDVGNMSTNTIKKKKVFETPVGGINGGNFNGGQDISPMILLIIAWLGTYIISIMSWVYNRVGLFWLAMALGIIVLIIVLIYWSNTKSEWIMKYFTEEITEEKLKILSDRDIITVVSRNDFVGEYLGHTAGKTKKLLEANIGKVVFIDEAYSLLNDPRDAYGYECLNTLNLFMSENPDKIVIIFAGYKEQIKSTIFSAQPGLERRCMWNFTCDSYSGDELTDIFFLQANKEGWYISDEDKKKIRKLIVRNENVFKNYGGDTQRLVYLASLEASRSNLTTISDSFLSCSSKDSKESSEKKNKVLTFKNVELGLISLKENKF